MKIILEQNVVVPPERNREEMIKMLTALKEIHTFPEDFYETMGKIHNAIIEKIVN